MFSLIKIKALPTIRGEGLGGVPHFSKYPGLRKPTTVCGQIGGAVYAGSALKVGDRLDVACVAEGDRELRWLGCVVYASSPAGR